MSSRTRPESRRSRHEQGRHCVGPHPPSREDHAAGDGGGDEREEVVEDVLEAPLDVERPAVRAGELPRREEVDPDPDEGDDEDRRAARVRRRDESTDRAVDDQPGKYEQRGPVRLRGEDLRAAQPERAVPSRRLSREPQHDERHRERPGVREHVRRVRQERQGVREDAGHDLAGHEGDDQRECQPEAASVLLAASVRVPVGVSVHRLIMHALRDSVRLI